MTVVNKPIINKPIINKPDMNYGLWAENGNIEIPSSEKVELGWIAEKPLNEQMNWVQNRQDAMLTIYQPTRHC